MIYHHYRTEPTAFYIEPTYPSPHGVYELGGAGCDPATLTDTDAALTLAYLEWFKVGGTQRMFSQAQTQATHFFKRNQVSLLALVRHLKAWREMKGLSPADVEQATRGLISVRWLNLAEQKNHFSFIQPDTFPSILLSLAELYHIFPPLLFAWMGLPIPRSELKKKSNEPVMSKGLTLEEAAHLTVYYSEAAVFANLRPDIYRKLDPSKTLARFEKQLQTCILDLTEKLPFLEINTVSIERVLQKVRFKFKFEPRQLWFPFDTKPLNARVKRALKRQPTTCYVFFSAEDHVRLLEEKEADDGFSLLADLMDAYHFSAFEARVMWHKVSLLDQDTITFKHKTAAARYLELIEDFCCRVPRPDISEATLDLIEFNAGNVVSVQYAQRVDILNFLDTLSRNSVDDFNFQLACHLVSHLLAAVPVYQLMYLTNFFSNEAWGWWTSMALRGNPDDDALKYVASVFSILTPEGKRAFWHVMRTVYLERCASGENEADPFLGRSVVPKPITSTPYFVCPFCQESLEDYQRTIEKERSLDGFLKKLFLICPFCKQESRVIDFFSERTAWTWQLIKPNKDEPPVILTFKVGLDTEEHALAGPQEAFEFLRQFVEDLSDDKIRGKKSVPPFSLEGLIVWASDNEVRYCPGWHNPLYYDPDLPRIIMPNSNPLDDVLSAILASRPGT
ncbi:MAG: hypothetical protein BroJett011_46960 [Chloroflexota bacterium]|nr:MAG: hypothetical protein BroJett011_46960 [Chloroflexota bacterium]